MAGAEDGYREVLLTERKKVLQRHLRVSEKLELGIEKLIDEALETGQLNDRVAKRLSEALSSVTAISARAASISDRAMSEMLGEREEGGGGKIPLVALGIQGDNVKVTMSESVARPDPAPGGPRPLAPEFAAPADEGEDRL